MNAIGRRTLTSLSSMLRGKLSEISSTLHASALSTTQAAGTHPLFSPSFLASSCLRLSRGFAVDSSAGSDDSFTHELRRGFSSRGLRDAKDEVRFKKRTNSSQDCILFAPDAKNSLIRFIYIHLLFLVPAGRLDVCCGNRCEARRNLAVLHCTARCVSRRKPSHAPHSGSPSPRAARGDGNSDSKRAVRAASRQACGQQNRGAGAI